MLADKGANAAETSLIEYLIGRFKITWSQIQMFKIETWKPL